MIWTWTAEKPDGPLPLAGVRLAVLLALGTPLVADVRAPSALRQAPAAALYERVSPAIVGLSCFGPTQQSSQPSLFFGSGTIIDPSGLVITTSTVIPENARRLRAYLAGGQALPATVVSSHEETELVLLRITPPRGKEQRLPYVRLGDSRRVRLGQPAFSLGNAFRSIELDDQVSLSAGIVSGTFDLTEEHFQSRYVGLAIETSAPINSGMDGGPLLDATGRLIGLLSLNYSRNRWLGVAVPVHRLKPLLGVHRGWFDDREESFRAYAGLELEEVAGATVTILSLDPEGPATNAGLEAGDVLLRADAEDLHSMLQFRVLFGKKKAGDRLSLEVSRDGAARRVDLDLLGRF